MGIPLLFTESGGTPDLNLVPYSGLFPGDDTFPGDDVFPNEGPTLEFLATPPATDEFGISIDIVPSPVTFIGGSVAIFPVAGTGPGVASGALGAVYLAEVPVGGDDLQFAAVPGEFTVAIDPLPVIFSAVPPSLGGQDTVVLVDAGLVTFDATPPVTSGGQLLILVPSVRELPPLRLHLDIETPSGRHFRWGEDEPNPANVPSGLRFSDTMPGGFENQDATLPRKTGMGAADLERLSTVRVYGAGGELAWEGRLERAPRVSGDQMSVSPSAVGYQAALEDDKTVTAVYIDRDLGRWRGPGISRQQLMYMALQMPQEPSTEADTETGGPGLKLTVSGTWLPSAYPVAEAWYDAGPNTKVAALYFTPSYSSSTVNAANSEWTLIAHVQDAEGSGVPTSSSDHFPFTAPQVFGPSPPRRFAFVQWYWQHPVGFASTIGSDGSDYTAFLRNVAVVGDHNLTVRSDGITGGFFSSDVVAHAVGRFAPTLNVSPESVQLSGFVIPHLVFHDSTTAAEIVRQATRFGLQDWAVWDDKTFWWHDRGARGRRWRARTGPAQLEETGESLERVWNSVLVAYQDTDGSTKTVGPPGSGADTESIDLKDEDPDNPANRAGIVRRDLLQMGTGTAASATEVGRQFLLRSKELDRSGRARFVGHVETDKGVTYPYWAPRAGDTVSFIDAADSSPRRIVRSEKDHSSRTCSVDLDAPPEGLQALLERLGVSLVDLGLN